MDVSATTRYARVSPTRVRDLARRIQGLPVSQALSVVDLSPRKGAFLLRKTLRSAIANAEANAHLAAEGLVVREAVAEDGPSLRRIRPRARGSAGAIRKRTCHIRIVLTDGKPSE